MFIKTAIILCCLVMTACASGMTYQDYYDKNKAKGMSHGEAIAATDTYCLSNACVWK